MKNKLNTEVGESDSPLQTLKYSELETGHFFRIAARPGLGRFFKSVPWVALTEDLEKLVNFKPDVEVFIDEKR